MNMDSQTEYEALREKILTFMIKRGWKDKIAKRRGFEQSLLGHSANCLDVMLTLLPALRMRMRLSEEQEQALILGISIHDVAKERDEWQAYVRGEGEYEPHIIPEYTVEAVKALAEQLGFGGQADARAGADLHMKSVQTAARIFAEAQNAGPRMVLLQRLVADVDNVASADGLLAAQDALVRSSLDKYVHTTYHILHVRGVSTTLLHQAAQAAFEKQGWTPLLFYPAGTLYLRPGAEEPVPVTAEMVQDELVEALNAILRDHLDVLPNIAVGKDIRASFFPMPDLFDHCALPAYLRVASSRVNPKKAKGVSGSSVVKYLNLRRLIDTTGDYSLARKSYFCKPSKLDKVVPTEYQSILVSNLSEVSQADALNIRSRIGEAYPEIAVFKVFKYIATTTGEETATELGKAYEGVFGKGSFNALTSTSNLMAALDQAFTVDFFWTLPLKRLAGFLQRPRLDVEGTVGTLEQKRRVTLLIDTLTKTGEIGFGAMKQPPTIDNFARDVASVFIGDLLAPEAVIADVQEFAKEQLRYYEQAKRTIQTEREVGHICPACNQPFEKGTQALADFMGGTSFTGRRLAYDREGLIICMACYYERLLRQIILGRKAYDLIVLMPRMNLGRYGGKVLLDKLDEIKRLVKGVATADTIDPDEALRFDMTWFVARQSLAADFSQMSVEDLLRLFTYRAEDKTVKKNLKKVIKRTQELLASEDLEEAKEEWERDFADWEEVARAIAYKEIDDELSQHIREAVYGLRPPIEFVAQTPNVVLAPSSNPRVSDKSALVDSDADSNTEGGLKQLLITLAFALGLDCSVAILQDDESLDELILGTNGVAYVPPLPTVRDLVARSRSKEARQKLSPAWLSQSEAVRWLRALASAVLLANKADYPPRNDLYQILTVRSKGALLRRIEQKGGMMSQENVQQLEAIGEVLR
jgi:hypothetical protein